jgi:hypothetical protein
MAEPPAPESRVFLGLCRRNLSPGEVEHWDAFWESPLAPESVLERRDGIVGDDEAFAWARARSDCVYVNVPHDASGRYWAGEGDPPEPSLRVWEGRPPVDPAPTLSDLKLAYWRDRRNDDAS